MTSQTNVSPATIAIAPGSADDQRIERRDMRNIGLSIFHRRTVMTEDHWKQVGALLQKVNEERLRLVYQEQLASATGSMNPASRNAPRTSRPVSDGSCALLRPVPRQ